MKIAILPPEYNTRERVKIDLHICRFTNIVEKEIGNCIIGRIIEPLYIIGETYKLNPNRKNDWEKIKNILINSVLKN